MKFQLFAFVLVIAGAYVVDLPNLGRSIVENVGIIVSSAFLIALLIIRIIVIQMISRAIKNYGLDALVIENEEIVYSPVPFLVEVKVFIENLKFTGANDISIHSLDYSVIFNKLHFDISLPQISVIVGDSGIQASIFDSKVEGQFSGSYSIDSIRLSGEARINIGIIDGISLRSVSLNLRVGDMRSDVSVVVQENDYSEVLNNLLNEIIPNALDGNRDNINRFLEDIVHVGFDRFS